MQAKLEALEQTIRRCAKVLVALSGGVDSALLAFLAHRVLGRDNMLAVTGDSATVPSEDKQGVVDFCRTYDIPHRFLSTHEYDNPAYRANPSDRCFYCKEELYRQLNRLAAAEGWPVVLDGTNASDLSGHRPGWDAVKAAAVVAPYVTLGIGKKEIREMVVPYVKEFQTDEPIRILIALEEQAAANTLNTDIAGEFFHAMKEGLTTHPAWQQHYGQDSAQLADKRVKGLIARSKFEVTAEDGNHRPYAVTDLARYEHDLNRAA